MASAFHGSELDRNAGCLEDVDQEDALAIGDQRVLVAVDDEERGGLLRDVGDGVGLRGLFLLLLDGDAEELRTGRIVLDAPGDGLGLLGHPCVIGGAEEVDDAVHLAGDVQVAADVETFVPPVVQSIAT